MKLTFRRAFNEHKRGMTARLVNVLNNIIWTVGSCFFWPALPLIYLRIGAILFTVGSIFATITILLDHFKVLDDLPSIQRPSATPASRRWSNSVNENSLLEPLAQDDYSTNSNSTNGNDVSYSSDALRDEQLQTYLRASSHQASKTLQTLSPQDAHWFLLERLLIKCEVSTGRMYFLGTLLYAIGSAFFIFPSQTKLTLGGCWLFILGSCLILAAVSVELIIVENTEFKKIAEISPEIKLDPKRSHWRHLHSLSDGTIMVAMCYLYMFGCLAFIVGTIFFFPSEIPAFGMVGVVLFIVGSIAFLVGAILDFVRFERHVLASVSSSSYE